MTGNIKVHVKSTSLNENNIKAIKISSMIEYMSNVWNTSGFFLDNGEMQFFKIEKWFSNLSSKCYDKSGF